MSTAPDFNEVILARKIRRALDEGAAQLPESTSARLAAARRVALARKKAEPVRAPQTVLSPMPALAGAGGAMGSPFGPSFGSSFGQAFDPAASSGKPRRGFPRLQLWLPLLALVAALIGIAHREDQQRLAELASLDAEVLSDALPLDAYLDHGFNEYLARNR